MSTPNNHNPESPPPEKQFSIHEEPGRTTITLTGCQPIVAGLHLTARAVEMEAEWSEDYGADGECGGEMVLRVRWDRS